MTDETYWTGLGHLLRLLSGKWDGAVLSALATGPRHWSEVLTAARSHPPPSARPDDDPLHLHESVLSRTLSRLEREGLVSRVEEPGIFPKSVTYRLTAKAASLLTLLTPAAEWAFDLSEPARSPIDSVGVAAH
ncbi:winged helix-turn-helix transcriptional regulator [Kutzneria viridogrisea]|uniref:winged helix-turn-helix transcriptional regulator n=1 Tax=Kutzneria viridogrisea TaxID=47990 RepID=UPI001602F454